MPSARRAPTRQRPLRSRLSTRLIRPATAGAASLSATADDTAVATDAATRALLQVRTTTDTAAATDAATRAAQAFSRPAGDTATATDTATRAALARSRTASDTAAATDVAAATVTLARTTADTANATDAAVGTVPVNTFTDAYEGTNGAAIPGATGTVTYDNTRVAHGSTAAKASLAASQLSYVEYTASGIGTDYVRIYYPAGQTFPAITGVNDRLARGITSGGTIAWEVRTNSAGQIDIMVDNVGVLTQTALLTPPNTTTTWRIEGKIAAGANNVELRLYAGDSATVTSTVTGTAATAPLTINRVRFGHMVNANTTGSVWIDDVGWSNITWLGPAGVAPTTRTAADTASASDAASRSLTLARTAADTAAATDAATRARTSQRTASDTAAATDTASRSLTSARAAADTAAASDAPTRVLTVTRTASDTAAATDVATRAALTRSRTAADTAAASDAAAGSGAGVLSRTATDTAAATDTATRARTSARTAAETASATDTATRTAPRSRTAADTAAATDTALSSTAHFFTRTAADTAVATDAATRAATVRSRTAADTAASTDTATRVSARTRTAADTATSTQTAAGPVARFRSAADIALASDAAVAVFIAAPTVIVGQLVTSATSSTGFASTSAPTAVLTATTTRSGPT